MVRHLGLSGDVIFTGFVADAELPRYYAAADAFAIASKFETQGLVVLEALASGRPVAGANYRAIPEFVQDGVNGALFEPNDVRGCAEAILRCLKQRDEMRGPARESALPFSIERCTRRLEHVYERLVAGGRTRPVPAIVPTWNEGKYLPALLESLRSQTVPPLEILIADSGSLDATAQVAAEAGGPL